MGDVTYGACCVDDFTARALGADFMASICRGFAQTHYNWLMYTSRYIMDTVA